VFFGRIRLRKFLGYECVCWTTYWQRPISATCHRVLQDVLRRYRFEHSEVAPTPTKRVSNSSPCYFAFAMAATLAWTARM